jgi:hypothetical protein
MSSLRDKENARGYCSWFPSKICANIHQFKQTCLKTHANLGPNDESVQAKPEDMVLRLRLLDCVLLNVALFYSTKTNETIRCLDNYFYLYCVRSLQSMPQHRHSIAIGDCLELRL